MDKSKLVQDILDQIGNPRTLHAEAKSSTHRFASGTLISRRIEEHTWGNGLRYTMAKFGQARIPSTRCSSEQIAWGYSALRCSSSMSWRMNPCCFSDAMIEGYFASPSGRAFVRATVVFRSLAVQWELSFLVDTGADRSAIMPDGVTRFGIKSHELEPRVLVAGVDGHLHFFAEPGGLLMPESDGRVQAFSLDILIAEPTQTPAVCHPSSAGMS